MIITILKKNKLPKNIPMSQYLKEQALGYFCIQFYGVHYYIPFTKDMKKVLKIKKEKEYWNIPNELNLDDMLRTIVDSIYLQVRDTVGSEIHRDLDAELRETFSGLFENYLSNKIEDKFKKLLPYKKGKNEEKESKK